MTSQQILAITNPTNGTINEVDNNNVAVYEALRLQFLLTSSKDFNERDIARTLKIFLVNNTLCGDAILSHDGVEFTMVNNNTNQSPFQKYKRVYQLQDEVIDKVVNVMIVNLTQVKTASTDDNYKNHLEGLLVRLKELKEYYLQHDNCLRFIECIKYLL